MLSKLKQTLQNYKKDRTDILAAALSYHLVFAIVPILLIILQLLSYFYSSSNLDKILASQLEANFNQEIAEFILTLVNNFIEQENPNLTNLISLILVLFSAAGLVGFLKKALNQIWHVEVKKKSWKVLVWYQIRNIILIVGLGSLLVISTIVSRTIPVLNQFYNVENWLWVINEILGILTATLIVFFLIQVLVEKETFIWQTLKGSLLTSFLMYFGRLIIDYYFSFFDPSSAFGATGSLVLFLIWIYYSAHIFFFGIQFVRVLNQG